MLGLGKKKPVAEHEAEGEIERVYHEIRQVLRVTGVNLNLRTWATCDKFLPAMWDALRPNLETRGFESAADRVRSDAVDAATVFPRLDAVASGTLGESQRFQLQRALNLYHYVNPKLLVLTSAVRLALDGESIGGEAATAPEQIERGQPARMFPMEMVAEEPEEKELRELFDDIKSTLALPSINSDYRTLGLWPDYLGRAWQKLKPLVGQPEYKQATDALRETSRSLARELPLPFEFSREHVSELGEDADAVVEKTRKFEELLPPLILNIAILQLDWKTPDTLRESPFPAAARTEVSR